MDFPNLIKQSKKSGEKNDHKLTTNDLIYRPNIKNRITKHTSSIEPIGIDTEADNTGRCFMICTSIGDTFTLKEFPGCLFTRKYRNKSFVAYNLKYDSGAFVQHLPKTKLKELQELDITEHNGYTYKTIGKKCISIRYGKNSVTIYDIYSFFLTSLDNASKRWLGEEKIEMETKSFSKSYIKENWEKLSEYCIWDAKLCSRLAEIIIKKFEDFDVYPQKLYSTAYVSWQYFKQRCAFVHVKEFYDYEPYVLNAAMSSYNGGKFEVTTRGKGFFHEYDIVSAYPYEITNLHNTLKARTLRDKKRHKDFHFGFINATIKIPATLPSPTAFKFNNVCLYPSGIYRKWYTAIEFDYFVDNGCDYVINEAIHLKCRSNEKPYHNEIYDLLQLKDRYKRENDELSYYTIKIFLNSLYGKFCQLTPTKDGLKAGSSWNPIFASYITAGTRTRIAEMQNKYPSIVAVHTDSITSTIPLDIKTGRGLGEWEESVKGEGIIVGSGVYQIGDKSKFRGFRTKTPLLDLLPYKGKTFKMTHIAPLSWREVAHRGLEVDMINRFIEQDKDIHINFDKKRMWLNDWKHYGEIRDRVIHSIPFMIQNY